MEIHVAKRRRLGLTLAVLFGVGLLVAAFRPVQAATASAAFGVDSEAVNRLVAAGLVAGRVTGDGEADYALDAAITRAELLTVLVRARGGTDAVQAYGGDPAFADTAGHWSTAWVAVGAGLSQEPLGYPDGTFHPDRAVTAAEAVAFVMKFLGIAPGDGPWPDDYFAGLAATGIADETSLSLLKLVAHVPAQRGLVFTLLDTAFSTWELADEGGRTVYERLADDADRNGAMN